MDEKYASKLQKDLRKRLDRLCWMHNEPALHLAEHFAELRRHVDLDAEKQIEVLIKKGDEEAIAQVNGKRLDFIYILQELEKRTNLQPKPEVRSSNIITVLETRFEAFKGSSSSLDDLEDSYVQLTREITDETDRVEKRLFGEETIIYCPHQNPYKLGSLIYFGDVFLSKRDIDYFLLKIFSCANACRSQPSVSQLLVPSREPRELCKSRQVLDSFSMTTLFSVASKFYYIAKTKEKYSGYSVKASSIDTEFISYMRTGTDELHISEDACVDISLNLFDVSSSTSCSLRIYNQRLESLHVNLLPSPFDRLTTLNLVGVHFESFDTTLLSEFTNLFALKIHATFSKDVKFDQEFLRPLRKLFSLDLTLTDSSCDFGLLKGLTKLRFLRLKTFSLFGEKRPRLSKTDLEQIISLPKLNSLELSCFDIETISREMFNGCRKLTQLELTRTRIRDWEQDADLNFGGFSSGFINSEQNSSSFSIKLIHSDIQALNAASFAGMTRRLSLTGNSIADLPPGVFDDLPSLHKLDLDKNRIRHISSGVFGKLDNLTTLKLDDNPIETIGAKAFAQLVSLSSLSLSGCRLKSIDSEMFEGLECLVMLDLSSNLIERIEVVAKDGRRINVAKVNLSDDEKKLVKKHLFTDLSGLLLLDLSRNKIEKLDLNCFSNLKGVFDLRLSSNKINELSGLARPELLSSLAKLFIDNNQLTAIDKSALPKNLYGLDLAKNYLKRLDEDFFAKFTQLESVNLSKNELTWTITEATFANCSQTLKRIYLSLNESIQVTEGAFREMVHLECIQYDFSGHFFSLPALEKLRIRKLTPEVVRALKELPRDQHDHLRQLHTCYLSGCSIRTLTRNSNWKGELDETPNLDDFNLSWLPKTWHLSKLDFSRNLIEMLDDPELFTDFKGMNKINLSGNRLSRIHRDIFKCLPCLVTIDLSGNNLSSIDMGLFRPLVNLKHLNLSSNNISFLNLARLFRICPDLESLNIADNQLDEQSTAEMIDIRSSCYLESLVLANNRLQTMHFVRDMTRLQQLDLRGNRIVSVLSDGENLLGRLRELTHLDLSGNRIDHVTDEMFAHLRGHLDLSGNPLDSRNNVLSKFI